MELAWRAVSAVARFAVWLGANYFEGRWGRELTELFPGFLALDPWEGRLSEFVVTGRAPSAQGRSRLRFRPPARNSDRRQVEEILASVGIRLARPGELSPAGRSCRAECVFELAPAAGGGAE